MFDIGWPELIVVGAVALVAVGPEDLPRVMNSLGRLARRARAAMHDFSVMLDQVGQETEPSTEDEKKADEAVMQGEADSEKKS